MSKLLETLIDTYDSLNNGDEKVFVKNALIKKPNVFIYVLKESKKPKEPKISIGFNNGKDSKKVHVLGNSKSMQRTSGVAPFLTTDTISYVVKELSDSRYLPTEEDLQDDIYKIKSVDTYKQKKLAKHNEYVKQLNAFSEWCKENKHKTAKKYIDKILNVVNNKNIMDELIKENFLVEDVKGNVIIDPKFYTDSYIKAVKDKDENKKADCSIKLLSTMSDLSSCLIDWVIELDNGDMVHVAEIDEIVNAYEEYLNQDYKKGTCFFDGEDAPIRVESPRTIGNLKLFSADDYCHNDYLNGSDYNKGTTFSGLLGDKPDDVFPMSDNTIQKVNSALGYLISGSNGHSITVEDNRTFVIWAINTDIKNSNNDYVPKNDNELLKMLFGTKSLDNEEPEEIVKEEIEFPNHTKNYGKSILKSHNKLLFKGIDDSKLNEKDTYLNVYILDIQSLSSNGNLNIRKFSELSGSEYINSITNWKEYFPIYRHKSNSKPNYICSSDLIDVLNPDSKKIQSSIKNINKKEVLKEMNNFIFDDIPISNVFVNRLISSTMGKYNVEKNKIVSAFIQGYNRQEGEKTMNTNEEINYYFGKLLATLERVENSTNYIKFKERSNKDEKNNMIKNSNTSSMWQNCFENPIVFVPHLYNRLVARGYFPFLQEKRNGLYNSLCNTYDENLTKISQIMADNNVGKGDIRADSFSMFRGFADQKNTFRQKSNKSKTAEDSESNNTEKSSSASG